MELRCPYRLHGVLVDGRIEMKCQSHFCGAGKGRVVLHYFDPVTGELLATRRFSDPKVVFGRDHKKQEA